MELLASVFFFFILFQILSGWVTTNANNAEYSKLLMTLAVQ